VNQPWKLSASSVRMKNLPRSSLQRHDPPLAVASVVLSSSSGARQGHGVADVEAGPAVPDRVAGMVDLRFGRVDAVDLRRIGQRQDDLGQRASPAADVEPPPGTG
jgi:hypothetical protein